MNHTKHSLSSPHLFAMVDAYNNKKQKRLILPRMRRCSATTAHSKVLTRLERQKRLQGILGRFMVGCWFAGVVVIVIAMVVS